MFERFKDGNPLHRNGGAREDLDPHTGGRTAVAEREHPTETGPSISGVRDRQREEFGGSDGTAIFFGWLSALGLAALLMAVLSAAGTRLGLASGADTADAAQNAETIGLIGAIAVLVVLALAYYGGGYVAGRMARFDGGRQGFRVWLLGLLVTIGLAVVGVVAGSEWNVLGQLNLPRIPVDEGDVALGAVITLAAVLLLTLLAAIGGGKAGERYHTKIDRFGWGEGLRR